MAISWNTCFIHPRPKSNLEEEFKFSSSQLKYTTIGTPSTHVDNLMKGIYCQQLTQNIKRAAAINLNLYGLDDLIDCEGCEDEKVSPILAEDIEEQSFGFESLGLDQKKEIEKVLTSLKKQLKKSIELRLTITPLLSAAVDSFHKTDWFDTEDVEESEKEAEKHLQTLITHLQATHFEIKSVLKGYISFLRYKLINCKNSPSLEILYQKFYEWSINEESHPIKPFLDLFELINVKSFSEAYCESVGSLMNILVKKGRNLSAAHFSRELIFAFNAPAIHVLSQSVIPEIAKDLVEKEQKYFFRKLDTSVYQKHKLKFKELSTSLGNLRAKTNTTSHLPVIFFK